MRAVPDLPALEPVAAPPVERVRRLSYSALARIKSYHDYGTFTPLQVAAIAALEGPQE